MFGRVFRHWLAIGLGALALVMCIGLLLTGTTYAQQDITPPALVSVTFEPATIDTSASPQTITVTVHVTDDLSGVERVGLFFRSISTTQHTQIEFLPNEDSSEIVAGDLRDGYHVATMTLPQYAAFGEWRLTSIVAVDAVGNHMTGSWPEDGTIGFWNVSQVAEQPQQTQTLFVPLLAR